MRDADPGRGESPPGGGTGRRRAPGWKARAALVAFGILLGGALAAAVAAILLPLVGGGRWGGHPVPPGGAAALRELLDDNPRSLFRYDPVLAYRFKPSFEGIRWEAVRGGRHRANSLGTVGDELDPDPARARVVVLGDSVAYGAGVREGDAMPARLQAFLGGGWQVVNAATPGWSTHQELRFHRDRLAGIGARAVVLVFCLNDLVRYEWVYGRGYELRESEELLRLGGREQGYNERTREGARVMALRIRFLSDRRLAPLSGSLTSCLRAWDEEAWREYSDTIFRPEGPPEPSTSWLVVAVPSRLQLLALARGAARGEAFYPQEMLARLCRERGIRFLDAAGALSAEGGRDAGAVFLPGDHLHLSPLGHGVVAREIHEELLRMASRGGGTG